MQIDSIIPTQNDLRNIDQMKAMIDYVKTGGIFSNESISFFDIFSKENSRNEKRQPPLIKIACFEDGKKYLHDGHHRTTSIFLGNRKFLYPEEYVIENWKYKDFLEINLDQKWYTPYDPRSEARICQIKHYKDQIKDLIKNNTTKQSIEYFIRYSYETKVYVEPKKVYTIEDLSKQYFKHSV